MGDKSPRSKKKNQTQKQSKSNAATAKKKRDIASKQNAGINFGKKK
jgi:hypothetical protein